MTYRVVKTINGRQYVYEQTSYRVGKKVKTKSVYLGRVASIFAPIPAEERGLRYIARQMEKYPAPPVARASPVPVPIEKPPTEINYATPNPEAQSLSQASDSAPASPEADE